MPFLYSARVDDLGGQLAFDFTADDLLEFPRDLGEAGYFQFHSEQRQATVELEKTFGVVLNKRVRLRLVGWNEEFEGRLVLDSLLLPSHRSAPLRLHHTDIELCQVLD